MEFSLICAGVALGAHVDGAFEFEADLPAGCAILRTEAQQFADPDLRLLGLRITTITIDGVALIEAPTEVENLPMLPFGERIEVLNRAARMTRWPANVELTRTRGPHSSEMDAWLRDNIDKYDILLTHNCVFRPPIEALRLAAERGVPSVFIPHIHLDDDFYHFPDVMRAIQLASVSLVSPLAAVDFLNRHVSHRVRYFGAGAEPAEFTTAFADPDLAAFRERVADNETPIILVLGRKAAAKNYAMTLEALRLLDSRGVSARVIMIGPDDDGAPIQAPGVVYLGQQPREVVRGALRAACVLVNMSASESFGIVLLEAWLAGTPVIANRRCAAFADLVEDGVSGFLVDDTAAVADRIARILTNPAAGAVLAERGREVAMRFSWRKLAEELDELCSELANSDTDVRHAQGPNRPLAGSSQSAEAAA